MKTCCRRWPDARNHRTVASPPTAAVRQRVIAEHRSLRPPVRFDVHPRDHINYVIVAQKRTNGIYCAETTVAK
jgi:hypothetical protein